MRRTGQRALAAACALNLLLSPLGFAQERPAGEPSDVINSLLTGLLGLRPVSEAELRNEVAEIGGIPWKRDVPIDYMNQRDAARYFEELFDSEYPPEQARAEERLLRTLDLLPAGADLRKLRARLMLDNVIGFYDERPEKRRLYAVSEDRGLTPANQLVLAHELRHALQDQYMPIHELLPASLSDFDDRRLSLLSLLEGDATLVMQRYLMRRLPGAAGALDTGALTLPTPEMPGTPAVLRDQLVLPYTVGLEFARQLVARSGWPGMQQAFTRPPESTEQVLHPQKYFDGERPQAVELAYQPPGGRSLAQGVLGELLWRTLLGEGREAAAAGWGGDAYRAFDVAGKTLVVVRSLWDSPEDLKELLAGLEARLHASHGAPRPLRGYATFERGGSFMAIGEWRQGALLVAADDGELLRATLQAF